jgi:hypothetical protein
MSQRKVYGWIERIKGERNNVNDACFAILSSVSCIQLRSRSIVVSGKIRTETMQRYNFECSVMQHNLTDMDGSPVLKYLFPDQS